MCLRQREYWYIDPKAKESPAHNRNEKCSLCSEIEVWYSSVRGKTRGSGRNQYEEYLISHFRKIRSSQGQKSAIEGLEWGTGMLGVSGYNVEGASLKTRNSANCINPGKR